MRSFIYQSSFISQLLDLIYCMVMIFFLMGWHCKPAIERTTRHWGQSILISKYNNFSYKFVDCHFPQTNLYLWAQKQTNVPGILKKQQWLCPLSLCQRAASQTEREGQNWIKQWLDFVQKCGWTTMARIIGINYKFMWTIVWLQFTK